MRPFPLPAACGLGYWHVGYRLHAKVATRGGQDLEGLYFVQSNCDRRVVTWAGNLLTDFRFRTARIRVTAGEQSVDGTVETADGTASFCIDRLASAQLADGSPFAALADAAKALEYPPRALCPQGNGALTSVQVRRDPSAWRWCNVVATEVSWLLRGLGGAPLELCYEVEPIDYLWERGRTVHVEPCVS
jgi:hypothetical protein